MLFHQTILPLLFLGLPMLSTAVTIASVIEATQVNAGNAENANDDVNDPDLLNDQVPHDIQNLSGALNATIAESEGVEQTTNAPTEQEVANAYNQLTSAIAALTQNLIDKKAVFIAALEGEAIYTALEGLYAASINYQKFIAAIVLRSDYKQAIFESGSDASIGIEDALGEYEDTA